MRARLFQRYIFHARCCTNPMFLLRPCTIILGIYFRGFFSARFVIYNTSKGLGTQFAFCNFFIVVIYRLIISITYHNLTGTGFSSMHVKQSWLLQSHDRHGVSNHRQLDCLFQSFYGLTSKKHQNQLYWPYCEGNPPVTGGFPAQRTNNAESVFMSWRQMQSREDG